MVFLGLDAIAISQNSSRRWAFESKNQERLFERRFRGFSAVKNGVKAPVSQNGSYLIRASRFGCKSGTWTVSVQRRRPLLGFDIELHEPVKQRGLSKEEEVASAILVAQRCVVSVLKQGEPKLRSEASTPVAYNWRLVELCYPALRHRSGNGKDRPFADGVGGCAGRPARGRRWKSVTVKA